MSDDQPFDGEGMSLQDILEKGFDIWEGEQMKLAVDSLEEMFNILETLHEDRRPLNVGRTALRLTGEMFEWYDFYRQTQPGGNRSPTWSKFLDITRDGHVVVDDYLTPLFLPFLDQAEVRLVNEDDQEEGAINGIADSRTGFGGNQGGGKVQLLSYCLEEGLTVYWVNNGRESTDIVCKGDSDPVRARQLIMDLVWEEYKGHIEVSVDDNQEIEFRTKDPLPWNYEGEQGPRLINRWKTFYEDGVRRSIILHGPPGTGKSTLARQVAKELDGRVMFVPVRMLRELRNIEYFTDVVSLLQPDILIIDDIDRLSRSELDLLLSFFEETENPVPLLITTTNHLSQLPKAIKRPGRFDEIWKLDPPSDEIRLRVIQYLAELEGVELSEDQAEEISQIAAEKDLPGAHIREIIRRIAVLGWDEIDFTENDLTFNSEWVEKSKYEGMPDNHDSHIGEPDPPHEEWDFHLDDDDMTYVVGGVGMEEAYGETLQPDSDSPATWVDYKNNMEDS